MAPLVYYYPILLSSCAAVLRKLGDRRRRSPSHHYAPPRLMEISHSFDPPANATPASRRNQAPLVYASPAPAPTPNLSANSDVSRRYRAPPPSPPRSRLHIARACADSALGGRDTASRNMLSCIIKIPSFYISDALNTGTPRLKLSCGTLAIGRSDDPAPSLRPCPRSSTIASFCAHTSTARSLASSPVQGTPTVRSPPSRMHLHLLWRRRTPCRRINLPCLKIQLCLSERSKSIEGYIVDLCASLCRAPPVPFFLVKTRGSELGTHPKNLVSAFRPIPRTRLRTPPKGFIRFSFGYPVSPLSRRRTRELELLPANPVCSPVPLRV
ncbi:hypothetical protein B0H15DRAFT_973788 [Mycena belliarum]|uniref:Uncharacterized protein n=1 Tax=Mycena belliarum TaxID=1033014 RepID=A0AAD6TK91_9AGAR|nr:hypothetical protein B0H15DRAFT_973788 [Mycena belliae]